MEKYLLSGALAGERPGAIDALHPDREGESLGGHIGDVTGAKGECWWPKSNARYHLSASSLEAGRVAGVAPREAGGPQVKRRGVRIAGEATVVPQGVSTHRGPRSMEQPSRLTTLQVLTECGERIYMCHARYGHNKRWPPVG